MSSRCRRASARCSRINARMSRRRPPPAFTLHPLHILTLVKRFNADVILRSFSCTRCLIAPTESRNLRLIFFPIRANRRLSNASLAPCGGSGLTMRTMIGRALRGGGGGGGGGGGAGGGAQLTHLGAGAAAGFGNPFFNNWTVFRFNRFVSSSKVLVLERKRLNAALSALDSRGGGGGFLLAGAGLGAQLPLGQETSTLIALMSPSPPDGILTVVKPVLSG
mmetsp:Transcript_38139/g.82616  ORF Transcript_38139/g.82616 Transcript_38139/m.82616 type:complete len:221 (-) Transcript_38139:142-804(-)